MRRKRVMRIGSELFAGMMVFLCLIPFVVVIAGGFWDEKTGVSVQAYYDVFLGTPRYLLRFWRSLFLCLTITVGR